MPTNRPSAETLADPVGATHESPARIGTGRPRLLLAALATGVLLWLCYFPVAWGWLGWIALTPLLVLVRADVPTWRRFLSGWLAGLVFFWATLQWLTVADVRMYYTWACLATVCALFVPAAVLLTRLLDRRGLPLILAFPMVWTALEFLRAHVLTGFPWYFLAHTQHAVLPVIQIADVGGAYAVSFLVATVNAACFEWLITFLPLRSLVNLPPSASVTPRLVRGGVIWACLLLVLDLAYGAYRLGHDEQRSGPRVALIQGNLDQRLRNEAWAPNNAEKAAFNMLRHFRDLSDEAGKQTPDLIVWPETSYPGEWVDVADGVALDLLPQTWWLDRAESDDLADKVAKRWKTNVLLGLNARFFQSSRPEGGVTRYNSALLLTPQAGAAGRYDKIHCVPFGEYVPLRTIAPWLKRFAPYDFDYSVGTGEQFTRFPLHTATGDYNFGVIICFEDTDPTLARQYVRGDDGPPVDFLVNISNDGWFDGSSEHEEHLAICRFRAVECRRAVVRAVNMGISAVIDGSGRVVALPGPSWSASKKVAGVVTMAVPLDRRGSLYASWGDWLPWACWIGIVGILLYRSNRQASTPSISASGGRKSPE